MRSLIAIAALMASVPACHGGDVYADCGVFRGGCFGQKKPHQTAGQKEPYCLNKNAPQAGHEATARYRMSVNG